MFFTRLRQLLASSRSEARTDARQCRLFAILHPAAETLVDVAVQAEDAVFPAVLSRRRRGVGPIVPRLLGVSSNLHPDHLHAAIHRLQQQPAAERHRRSWGEAWGEVGRHRRFRILNAFVFLLDGVLRNFDLGKVPLGLFVRSKLGRASCVQCGES